MFHNIETYLHHYFHFYTVSIKTINHQTPVQQTTHSQQLTNLRQCHSSMSRAHAALYERPWDERLQARWPRWQSPKAPDVRGVNVANHWLTSDFEGIQHVETGICVEHLWSVHIASGLPFMNRFLGTKIEALTTICTPSWPGLHQERRGNLSCSWCHCAIAGVEKMQLMLVVIVSFWWFFLGLVSTYKIRWLAKGWIWLLSLTRTYDNW